MENIEFEINLATIDEISLGINLNVYGVGTIWDGFSWDPNYNVGDNLNEGLMLFFENDTNLDWRGY